MLENTVKLSFLFVIAVKCNVFASEWVSKEDFQSELEKVLNLVKNVQNENQRLRLEVTDLSRRMQYLSEDVEELKSENRLLKQENQNANLKMTLLSHQSKSLMSSPYNILRNDSITKTISGEMDYSADQTETETSIAEKQFEELKTKGRKIRKNRPKDRRLMGESTTEEHVIAFSAYITRKFGHEIGQGHVFVYDAVQANVGNAYNNNTGIFSAPVSGIYAFLWTISAEGMKGGHTAFGEVVTELVVNSNPRGQIHADTETAYDDAAATGFVILHLNANDVVFIRSSLSPMFSNVQGALQLSYEKEWTFSGWKL